MYQFNHKGKVLKTTQIIRFITKDIELRVMQKADKLLSINDFSKKYGLARDTVEKAYKELVKSGLVEPVAGKGYYVKGKKNVQLRVLLIFNKLSSYKKIVYDSMVKSFGKKAKVDLQVHHYDLEKLKEIIDENIDRYHFYVIMPHFFPQVDNKKCVSTINRIPHDKLVILDKKIAEIKHRHICVYQDFEQDIYNALHANQASWIKKYTAIAVIFPEHSYYPAEVLAGVRKFCAQHTKKFIYSKQVPDNKLSPKTLYIVLSEEDLALLLKKMKAAGFTPGKDAGVVSFNETPLKELLNITVVSTDFEAMGQKATEMMLHREYNVMHNPFFMIQRGSL